MKLEPRMVPKPIWGVALRTSLKSRWLPEVSRPVRNHAMVCEVCGGRGHCRRSRWRLCCDEVWDYSDADPVVSALIEMVGADLTAADLTAIEGAVPLIRPVAFSLLDAPPVARLTDLQAICWDCNAMIHFGHTESTAKVKGWAGVEPVVSHAARVNGVPVDAMVQRIIYAKAAWLIRSHVPGWTITWDGWESIRDRKAGRSA